jgi:hypothetical protein
MTSAAPLSMVTLAERPELAASVRRLSARIWEGAEFVEFMWSST